MHHYFYLIVISWTVLLSSSHASKLTCACDLNGAVPCKYTGGDTKVCEFDENQMEKDGYVAVCVAAKHRERGVRYSCGFSNKEAMWWNEDGRFEPICKVIVGKKDNIPFDFCECNDKNFCNRNFFEDDDDDYDDEDLADNITSAYSTQIVVETTPMNVKIQRPVDKGEEHEKESFDVVSTASSIVTGGHKSVDDAPTTLGLIPTSTVALIDKSIILTKLALTAQPTPILVDDKRQDDYFDDGPEIVVEQPPPPDSAKNHQSNYKEDSKKCDNCDPNLLKGSSAASACQVVIALLAVFIALMFRY